MLQTVLMLLVTVHNLQSATVVSNKSTYTDNAPITFLDPDQDCYPPDSPDCKVIFKFGEELIVHKSCENQTYCTVKPINYPEDKFNDMLKDFKIPPLPTYDALGNRQGDINYEDDCETEVTYEPLYTVREKREEPWRVVVQAPKHDYVQKVRLEICKSKPGASCFTPFTSSSGYESTCHQLYNKWEVLVENKETKGTELIKAELPVCCSCKYKRMGFITRFNAEAAMEPVKNKTKA